MPKAAMKNLRFSKQHTLQAVWIMLLVVACGACEKKTSSHSDPRRLRGVTETLRPGPPQNPSQFVRPQKDKTQYRAEEQARPIQAAPAPEVDQEQIQESASRALHELAGSPTCIRQMTQGPASVSFSVTAHVSNVGVVTRAEVNGALPEDVRECVRRAVESGRLPAGVPSVTTTVEFQRGSREANQAPPASGTTTPTSTPAAPAPMRTY